MREAFRKINKRELNTVLRDIFNTKWKGTPKRGWLYKVTHKGKEYYRFITSAQESDRWDLTLQEIKEPK